MILPQPGSRIQNTRTYKYQTIGLRELCANVLFDDKAAITPHNTRADAYLFTFVFTINCHSAICINTFAKHLISSFVVAIMWRLGIIRINHTDTIVCVHSAIQCETGAWWQSISVRDSHARSWTPRNIFAVDSPPCSQVQRNHNTNATHHDRETIRAEGSERKRETTKQCRGAYL